MVTPFAEGPKKAGKMYFLEKKKNSTTMTRTTTANNKDNLIF